MIKLLVVIGAAMVFAAGCYAAYRTGRLVARWRWGEATSTDTFVTFLWVFCGTWSIGLGTFFPMPMPTLTCAQRSLTFGVYDMALCFPLWWHWGLLHAFAALLGFLKAGDVALARRTRTRRIALSIVAGAVAAFALIGGSTAWIDDRRARGKYVPKSGRVVDASGNGIEGVYVYVRGTGNDGKLFSRGGFYTAITRTDATGHYRFPDTRDLARRARGPYKAQWTVDAYKPGHVRLDHLRDGRVFRAYEPYGHGNEPEPAADGSIVLPDIVMVPARVAGDGERADDRLRPVTLDLGNAMYYFTAFEERQLGPPFAHQLQDALRREVWQWVRPALCAASTDALIDGDLPSRLQIMHPLAGRTLEQALQLHKRPWLTAGFACGVLSGTVPIALPPPPPPPPPARAVVIDRVTTMPDRPPPRVYLDPGGQIPDRSSDDRFRYAPEFPDVVLSAIVPGDDGHVVINGKEVRVGQLGKYGAKVVQIEPAHVIVHYRGYVYLLQMGTGAIDENGDEGN